MCIMCNIIFGFWVDAHFFAFIAVNYESMENQMETSQFLDIQGASSNPCNPTFAMSLLPLLVLTYEVLVISLFILFIMIFDLRDKGCYLWHRNSAGALF